MIDRLIHERQMQNGTKANADVAYTRVTKAREAICNAAGLPKAIAIVMPAFKDTAPLTEVTAEMLAWLTHATNQTFIRDRLVYV